MDNIFSAELKWLFILYSHTKFMALGIQSNLFFKARMSTAETCPQGSASTPACG